MKSHKILKFCTAFADATSTELVQNIDTSMKTFFTQLNNTFPKILNKFNYLEHTLGNITVHFSGKTLHLPIRLYTKNEKVQGPTLLIVSGFHGDETAGPIGIIRFLERHPDYLKKANLSFLPIANPVGFLKLRRWGYGELDVNRGYEKPHSKEDAQEPSIEGDVLKKYKSILLSIAKDGMMDLHEDPDGNEAFVYAWENDKHSGRFPKSARDFAAKFFKISTERSLKKKDQYTDGAGLIHNDLRGTFEQWMFKSGVPHILTTETPGMELLSERVDCDAEMIAHFVNYHINFKKSQKRNTYCHQNL